MAALEVIWDAIARQAALVEGVKAAYATGAGGQGATVNPYPDDILDGPVAVVDYLGSEIEHGGFEKLTHQFAVVLWVPRGNGTREAAVKLLAPMFERFHLAFDQNVGLFGVLGSQGEATVRGSGAFEDDQIEDKDYVVQALLVDVWVAVSVSHAMGPSS